MVLASWNCPWLMFLMIWRFVGCVVLDCTYEYNASDVSTYSEETRKVRGVWREWERKMRFAYKPDGKKRLTGMTGAMVGSI